MKQLIPSSFNKMNALKIAIKKFLKLILYIFVFLFITFTVCEIWFRVQPESPPKKYFKRKILARIWDVWLNEKNTDVLAPPFKVFSNTDIDDIRRLHFIVKAESLPKNTTLNSYDFLRPQKIKNETSYTATINNLGFRDPPRTIQKPRNVFRIIVLGSYQAFGHGVNDEDTYSWQLEHILNNSDFDNIHFEVWNGGRHAATAIVGWARLKTEILDYKPDLIIWDYGFVDGSVMGDDNLPTAFLHPNSGIYRPLLWLLHLMRDTSALKSVTIFKFEEYLVKRISGKDMKDFFRVSRRMLELTRQNNIPVILLRQSIVVAPRLALYQHLSNGLNHVTVVDGTRIFEKYPPDPELVRKFHSGKNWLSEFDPDLEKEPHWWPPEYFTDIYQYNKWGHRAIAEYLADKVRIIVKEYYLKNRQYKLPGE